MRKKKCTTRPPLSAITKLFALPLQDAAFVLGISKSFLKKICLEKNIPRWPYRRLRSLDDEIGLLINQMQYNSKIRKERKMRKAITSKVKALCGAREFILRNPQKSTKTNFYKTNTFKCGGIK